MQARLRDLNREMSQCRTHFEPLVAGCWACTLLAPWPCRVATWGPRPFDLDYGMEMPSTLEVAPTGRDANTRAQSAGVPSYLAASRAADERARASKLAPIRRG